MVHPYFCMTKGERIMHYSTDARQMNTYPRHHGPEVRYGASGSSARQEAAQEAKKDTLYTFSSSAGNV